MKRFLAILLVLALVFTTGCAGKQSGEQTTGSENQNSTLSSMPPEETVPGYVPSEVTLPDWIGRTNGMENWGNTIWLTNDENGIVAGSYDTMTGSWQRYDLDTGDAMNPTVKDFSATENALWLLLHENAPEDSTVNYSWDSLKYYVLSLNLLDGSTSCVAVGFSGEAGTETSSLHFSGIIALD